MFINVHFCILDKLQFVEELRVTNANSPIIEIRNYLYLLRIYQNPNRKLEVVKVLGRVIGLIQQYPHPYLQVYL